jgi:hypothetical protein
MAVSEAKAALRRIRSPPMPARVLVLRTPRSIWGAIVYLNEDAFMEKLPPDLWLDRCANRIVEIDQQIDVDEAADIARQLQSFERTAVMAPEAAVDFVAAELARGQHTRFERRASPRP